MREGYRRIAVALLLLGASMPAGAAPAAATEVATPPVTVMPGCALEAGPTRSVANVLDAETVRLDDGKLVRLVGALGPRAADVGAEPGQWPPEEESKAALSALVLGRAVRLRFGGRRSDRHGHVLAHLYREGGEGEDWIQATMLRLGHARAYTMPESEHCAEALLVAEAQGRRAGLGLWRSGAYQVRSASSEAELARYRGTFQLVEGRIARHWTRRGTSYFEFAEAAQRSSATPRRELGFLGLMPRELVAAGGAKEVPDTGARVRLRGWIEGRSRPTLILSTRGQLEVLAGDASTGPGLPGASTKSNRPAREAPGDDSGRR